MDNMEIYEAVRSVPSEACREFDNGSFSGTDINPMWRIKTLTEQFGPCGIGWYYEVISERSEPIGDNDIIAIVDLNLYIKIDGEWSRPIFGTGGNKLQSTTRKGTRVSDEGYKMALTDALSVACKALGIGADVYWSADKTKYTASAPAEEHIDTPTCVRCGKPISDVRTKNQQFSAGEIIGKSKLTYGDIYCWSCMLEMKRSKQDA